MGASDGAVRARAQVEIVLKAEIADPQGQTVERALPALGWSNVEDVRVGKHLEFVLEGESMEALRRQVEEMCEGFLANPVIETYRVSLESA